MLPFYIFLQKCELQNVGLSYTDTFSCSFFISILILYLCLFFNFSLFYVIYSVALIVSLYLYLKNRFKLIHFEDQKFKSFLISIGFLYWMVPSLIHEYPLGWDPYFHGLLAESIKQSQSIIYNWLPQSKIPLTYPIAINNLIAIIANFLDLPIHIVFKSLFSIFSIPMAMQVYSFVNKGTNAKDVSLVSMLIFLFTTNHVGISNYEWGGLPNLVALWASITMATLVFKTNDQNFKIYASLLSVLFISITLIHHHSMVTIGVQLLLLALWAKFKWESNLYLKLIPYIFLTSLPFLIRYALKIPLLKYTYLTNYYEPAVTPLRLFELWGGPLILFFIIGCLLAMKKRIELQCIPIFKWNAYYFLAMLILFDYIFRFIYFLNYGKNISFFTATRFSGHLTFYLFPIASLPIIALTRKLKQSKRILLCTLLFCTILSTSKYKVFLRPPVKESMVNAYHWIRDNTPKSTFVINTFIEAPYITKRKSLLLPLPASEPVKLRKTISYKRQLLEGQIPADFEQYKNIVLIVTPENQLILSKLLQNRSTVLKDFSNGIRVVSIKKL